LAALSLGAGVLLPESPKKSDFVPQRRRSNTSKSSEVSANMTFLVKLSKKEIYFKNGS
jgi:hypothetical protein